MKRSHKDKIIAATCIAAFGGFMYLKNRFMPKYADDYPYSFIWEGEEHGNLAQGDHKFKRVRTVEDLVRSQISHYKTWDGRTIAESLVQIFLMPESKKLFDAANTAMVLAQLGICAGLAKGRKKSRIRSCKKALMLISGFWACTPHLAATCLWLTGSMNYLWVGTLQSLFVSNYARKYHDPSYKIPVVPAALLGLLAGWSTETGAGAAIMLTGMEILYARTRKESDTWMTAGFAGLMAGFLLLMLAPGNRVKYQTERDFSDTLPTDLENRLPGYVPPDYLYTPYMFKSYFKESFLPVVLRELPLQVPVLVYLMNRQCRTREADLYIAALESAAWAVPTVMLLSPEYPIRSAYPSVIYLLAASIYALEQTGDDVFPYDSRWFKALTVTAGGAVIISMLASLVVDADFYRQMSDQIEAVKGAGKNGKITVTPVMPPPIYSFAAGDRSVDLKNCMGLGDEDFNDPYNLAASTYYDMGEFNTDYNMDHPYEEKGERGIKEQLIQPVKSLMRRLMDVLRGVDTA